MVEQVLCTCVWCLQESNGQGKLVGKTTRARHIAKQKKTWASPTNMPTPQRQLVTSVSQTMASLASLLDGEDQDYSDHSNYNDHDHNDHYNEEFASMYDVNPELSRDIVIDEVEMQRYLLSEELHSEDIDQFENEEEGNEERTIEMDNFECINFGKLIVKIHDNKFTSLLTSFSIPFYIYLYFGNDFREHN